MTTSHHTFRNQNNWDVIIDYTEQLADTPMIIVVKQLPVRLSMERYVMSYDSTVYNDSLVKDLGNRLSLH